MSIFENPSFTQFESRATNSVWVDTAMLGGFAIVLYFVLNMIVCCCVNKKFENYLVSELYMATEAGATVAGDGTEGEDADDITPASEKGCCGGRSMLSRFRYHIPQRFHNEIFG